jgi:hypothetical protein
MRRLVIVCAVFGILVVALQATGIAGLLGIWMPLIVGVAVFPVLLIVLRRGYREHNEIRPLLEEGRVLEALSRYEAVRGRMSNPVPLMNIGLCQLLLWRTNDAVQNLELFAKRSSGVFAVPGGDKVVASQIALAHALLGNAQACRTWAAKSPRTAIATLSSIVLEARAQNWAEAERLLRANDVVLDQLGGVLRAFTETVAAYVASKTGGRTGRVDPVRMFRESSVESLKPLWPELYDFIVRANQTAALV